MNRYVVAAGALLVAATSFAGTYPSHSAPASAAAVAPQPGWAVATFAGGCFWSMEYDFDKVDGVKQTISGFMGGRTPHPSYAQVSMGDTGHAESVQVTYDPKVVSYLQLLEYYWRHVDVVDGAGQFCDRGDEYRPVIFAGTPDEKRLAEASKAAIARSGRFSQPIAVAIVDAGPFTPAEDYHQNFHQNNSLQYHAYRLGCRRDARLRELWGADAGAVTR